MGTTGRIHKPRVHRLAPRVRCGGLTKAREKQDKLGGLPGLVVHTSPPIEEEPRLTYFEDGGQKASTRLDGSQILRVCECVYLLPQSGAEKTTPSGRCTSFCTPMSGIFVYFRRTFSRKKHTF